MIIIGQGRVGSALAERSERTGIDVHRVSRDHGWSALDGPAGGPILVAVRNADLEGVLKRVPTHRRADLVFIQNGMIRPWLEAQRLQSCGRGLIYFAVPTLGAAITPGVNSVFTGTHAPQLVHWFYLMGLGAVEHDWAAFSADELEKIMWNSAFGLLCDAYQVDVGTLVRDQRDELNALIVEFSRLGRIAMGVDRPVSSWVDRLCVYSQTIPTYRGSVKEWSYRNGWFEQVARTYDVTTPVHHRLLAAAGHGDLLA